MRTSSSARRLSRTITCSAVLAIAGTAAAIPPLLKAPAPATTSAPATARTDAPGDVRVQSAADGITLQGVLTLPEGAGPFPAVVLISGAGQQDRHGDVLGRPIARTIADHLAVQGIGSLRYADRGTDGSTGNYSAATLDDFALDAAGALAFLKAHTSIDRDRVAYVAHGEGGLAAAKATMRIDKPAALVLLATPAAPGGDVLADHQARLLTAGGIAPDAVETVVAAQRAVVQGILNDAPRQELSDLVATLLEAQYRAQFNRDIPPEVVLHNIGHSLDQARSPAVRALAAYDPAADLARVRLPVLAVLGGLDLQSSVGLNAEPMARALAGNARDATITILPRMNHFLQRATTGLPNEYAQLRDTPAPEVLDVLTDWLTARLAVDR